MGEKALVISLKLRYSVGMTYPIMTVESEAGLRSIAFRHPWIFSKQVKKPSRDIANGDIVWVADPNGAILATGTFSPHSMISVRILAFEKVTLSPEWVRDMIARAQHRRERLGYGFGDTTGYRVVFGEADGLAGLVVDRYGDVIVFQMSTAGMVNMRHDVLAALESIFSPTAIIEKSEMNVRGEEGLAEDIVTCHVGTLPERILFRENGATFMVDPIHGQKTGFFLDQKDLRALIRRYAKGRSVLNVFSYSGAASVMAMLGGATRVVNVDSSEQALAWSRENAALNGVAADAVMCEKADAFQWIGREPDTTFDMIILDPPALIKGRRDLEAGRKAYHFLNRAALRWLADDGILITSSCSHYLTEEDLNTTLRRASLQSKVMLDVWHAVRQSPDHPISLYFPESAYLKSIVAGNPTRPPLY